LDPISLFLILDRIYLVEILTYLPTLSKLIKAQRLVATQRFMSGHKIIEPHITMRQEFFLLYFEKIRDKIIVKEIKPIADRTHNQVRKAKFLPNTPWDIIDKRFTNPG